MLTGKWKISPPKNSSKLIFGLWKEFQPFLVANKLMGANKFPGKLK